MTIDASEFKILFLKCQSGQFKDFTCLKFQLPEKKSKSKLEKNGELKKQCRLLLSSYDERNYVKNRFPRMLLRQKSFCKYASVWDAIQTSHNQSTLDAGALGRHPFDKPLAMAFIGNPLTMRGRRVAASSLLESEILDAWVSLNSRANQNNAGWNGCE